MENDYLMIIKLVKTSIMENQDSHKDFNQWVEDNVITMEDNFGNEYFSTQDALYCNKIYGMDNLLMYYKKEFLIIEKN